MHYLEQYCSSAQWNNILLYKKLVQDTNDSINLVSRQDEKNILEHHIAPSFAFKILNRIQPAEYILDIGSGGGFPGIINAILFPNTKFLLVDSTRKKVEVLQYFISELNLHNVTALWTRVENMTNEEYQHVLDRTTSRAVTSLAKLLKWSRPLLKPGGHVEAMKGGDLKKELSTIHIPYAINHLPKEFHSNEKMKTLKLISIQLP